MQFSIRLIVFLVINFGVLFLGSLSMGEGPISDWYTGLNQAPWTPPGWVFGAAWFSLMFCFSIYMALLWRAPVSKSVKFLFGLSLLLNGSWNYIFFNQHQVLLALINICGLLAVITYLTISQRSKMGLSSLFALPYIFWLLIATSLNSYILLYN
jgi:tryptophan-rich sensory protein